MSSPARKIPAERRKENRRLRAVRDLNRALADRARGRCLVIDSTEDGLVDAIRAAGRTAVPASVFGDLPDAGPSGFETVFVRGVLECLEDAQVRPLLEAAWDRVRPAGRMIVVVPNEALDPEARTSREWKRRTLRRELRPFGRPRVLADQPLRWLAMMLEKPGERPPKLSSTDRRRAESTAKLCRGRVVDLGCGPGHLAGIIRRRGHEVVGVDTSREKIESARRLYPDVTFQVADIRDLDLPERSFDTAVLTEVLEHVPESEGDRILAKAASLVRPGGRLVVSVPNEDCVPHRNHVREFDRKSLRSLLRAFGKARLVTDQPFKWLLMVVEIPS